MDPHFLWSLSSCCSHVISTSLSCFESLRFLPSVPECCACDRCGLSRDLTALQAFRDGTQITGTDRTARCSATPQPRMNKRVCVCGSNVHSFLCTRYALEKGWVLSLGYFCLQSLLSQRQIACHWLNIGYMWS